MDVDQIICADAIAQRQLRMPFDPHPIEADSDLPDLPMFQFIQAQE